MNKVILTGRLTADVELKEYGKGKEKGKYCNFCVAVRRDSENTDFINCTAFDMVAEILEKYVEKGKRIIVEGRLSVSNYEDEEGKKHNQLKVIANNIEFADGRKEQEDSNKKTYYKK